MRRSWIWPCQRGLDRRVTEPDLVQQRQQERHAIRRQAREKAATDGDAEGTNASQGERQQRV